MIAYKIFNFFSIFFSQTNSLKENWKKEKIKTIQDVNLSRNTDYNCNTFVAFRVLVPPTTSIHTNSIKVMTLLVVLTVSTRLAAVFPNTDYHRILKFKLYYFHSTITNIEGYININAILWFLTYSAKQNCVCICDIEVVVIILMHYRLNEMMGIVTACVQFVYIHKDM